MYGENVKIIQMLLRERTEMQKTMFQFLYIRQGLINLYKLDKSYYAKHIAAKKKGVAFHTQVGVVNPEQKQLKLDISSEGLQNEPFKCSLRTS